MERASPAEASVGAVHRENHVLALAFQRQLDDLIGLQIKREEIGASGRRIAVKLIRMSIDSFLQREAGTSGDRKRARAKSAAGRFASSLSDISAEHDKYLAEAIGQP